jgi:hypothetical protein
MPIDINLLRPERGGDPEIVRESQRRRFASVDLVDQVGDKSFFAMKWVLEGGPELFWRGGDSHPVHPWGRAGYAHMTMAEHPLPHYVYTVSDQQ